MDANQAPAPPKGFRKEVPCGVKFDVALRQDMRCSACGERLGVFKATQFDHEPALALRGWDPDAGDTIPPANDPEALYAKHKDCHLAKTTGRKGESKLNAVHGDVAEIARLRRLTEDQKEFQRRLLAKGGEGPETEDLPKKKSRWPKRPFPGGRREQSKTRSSARDARVNEDRRDRRVPVRQQKKA